MTIATAQVKSLAQHCNRLLDTPPLHSATCPSGEVMFPPSGHATQATLSLPALHAHPARGANINANTGPHILRLAGRGDTRRVVVAHRERQGERTHTRHGLTGRLHGPQTVNPPVNNSRDLFRGATCGIFLLELIFTRSIRGAAHHGQIQAQQRQSKG